MRISITQTVIAIAVEVIARLRCIVMGEESRGMLVIFWGGSFLHITTYRKTRIERLRTGCRGTTSDQGFLVKLSESIYK